MTKTAKQTMSWYDDEDDRRKRKRGSATYVGVSPFAGAVDHGYGPELGELSEGVGAPYSGGLSQPPSTQTQPPPPLMAADQPAGLEAFRAHGSQDPPVAGRAATPAMVLEEHGAEPMPMPQDVTPRGLGMGAGMPMPQRVTPGPPLPVLPQDVTPGAGLGRRDRGIIRDRPARFLSEEEKRERDSWEEKENQPPPRKRRRSDAPPGYRWLKPEEMPKYDPKPPPPPGGDPDPDPGGGGGGPPGGGGGPTGPRRGVRFDMGEALEQKDWRIKREKEKTAKAEKRERHVQRQAGQYSDHMRSLQAKIDQLRQGSTGYRRNATKHIGDLEHKLREYSDKMRKLDTQSERQQQEFEQYQKDAHRGIRAREVDAKDFAGQASQRYGQLETQYRDFQGQASQKYGQLEAQLKDFQGQASEKYGQLETQYKMSQGEIARQKGLAQDWKNRAESYFGQGKSLEKGLGLERSRATQITAKAQQLQSEVERLSQEKQRLSETGSKQLNDLEAERKRLADMFNQQKGRADLSARDLAALKQQYTDDKADLAQQIADQKAELDRARAEHERALREARDAARAAPAAPAERRRRSPERRRDAPVTVVAPGGGGASSSASGGSAASGGGQAAARAPDLSKVVEAVKQIAAKAAEGSKRAAPKGGAKGITAAKRQYTDRRKVKLAEIRALKAKRVREFNTKTKKMPKAERDKARREFKKKVNAQFKELSGKFPTARGLKTVGVIRELIKKLASVRLPK